MNILIAGYGFVGRAHEAVLKNTFNVSIYDPMLGYHDIVAPSGVIICVSTPAHTDGACNVNNVADVISRIAEEVPILIKSTISVEGWRALKQLFPDHQLAFSPEFLRAASAIEDFTNTREIYIGGDNIGFWHALFRVAFDDDTFTSTVRDPESLILAKYFRNSFLATKVTFFNQVYDLCDKLDIDYETVAQVVTDDPRIGNSHTQVTDERGFGGHCFPKDTSAIVLTAKRYGTKLDLIERSIQYNNSIRTK